MSNKPHAINLKYWLPAIFLLVLAMLWLTSIAMGILFQKQTFVEQTRHRLLHELSFLTREVNKAVSNGDLTSARYAIQARAVDTDFRFLGIIDVKGKVVFGLQSRWQNKNIAELKLTHRSTDRNRVMRSHQSFVHYDQENKHFDIYAPVATGIDKVNLRSSKDWYIYGEYELSRQLSAFQLAALKQNLPLLLLLAISIIGLMIVIKRYIQQPVEHLVKISKQIVRGEEPQLAIIRGSGELAELANAYNRMAITLQKRYLERDRAHQKISEDELIFDGIFEAIPDLYFLMDSEGVILDYRTSMEEELYREPGEFLGRKMTDVLPESASHLFADAIGAIIKEGGLTCFEYSLLVSGKEQFFEARLSRLDTAEKILVVVRNITEKRTAEQEIFKQAYFDTLTSLPNRFLMLDRLQMALKDAARQNKNVGVLFLDLDDFKKINDTLGHETGDKLLVEAAKRLQQVIRGNDTVARQGGDEFIFVVSDIEQPLDMRTVAQTVTQAFSQPFEIDGRELLVTTSIGISIYPNDGENADELLRKADSAMYFAKAGGRNNYAFFTEGMNKAFARRIEIEEQIARALSNDEFSIHIQPKIDLRSSELVGGEVLLRWQNDELGNVSPAEFIPIAEQSGLVVEIGYWIIETAVNWLAEHMSSLSERFTLAINVSPRQFRDPQFVESVLLKLENSAISASRIKIEITEGVLLEASGFIEAALVKLSEAGFVISMDDFGTGYSSMNYLRQYPFNELKIDRCFVSEMCLSDKSMQLVNATIDMSHALGLSVVAEGVETEQQHQKLVELNCDIGQGYLYSRPLPLAKFEKKYLSAKDEINCNETNSVVVQSGKVE